MGNYLYFLLVCCWNFRIQNACHTPLHGIEKRQVSDDTEVGRTFFLRDYFTKCLRSTAGGDWDWQSIVDNTILDSWWYESNSAYSCSAAFGVDTANCWVSRLSSYLRDTSTLIKPITYCIYQYSADVAGGAAAVKPTVATTTQSLFSQNSLIVNQYSRCNALWTRLPRSRSNINFSSLFKFVADHTKCSPEVYDCITLITHPLFSRLSYQSRWPYRFYALTRRASPQRLAIDYCNRLYFPLTTSSDSTQTVSTTTTSTMLSKISAVGTGEYDDGSNNGR